MKIKKPKLWCGLKQSEIIPTWDKVRSKKPNFLEWMDEYERAYNIRMGIEND